MKKVRHNYIPWNRSWVTVRRHLPIVLKPLLLATLMVIFWKLVIVRYELSFSAAGENPILFLIMPLVAFVYVIFASIAVGSVFDEYKTISRCVIKGDVETFLIHRDEQLPIMMHILVGVPSVFLVLLTMLFHYHDQYVGAFAVFCVVYVVTQTWVIATELDKYEKSIWFKEKIPQEWFEIEVEDYFANEK